MKRSIIIGILAVLVLGTIVVWMINSENSMRGTLVLMVGIQVVVLVYAGLVIFKRWTARKNKLPTQDELSKKILLRSTAASYHLSLYMWLALMYFEERIDLERSSLIGAGILGMAILFGLSWVYHNYIRRSND